MSDAYTPRSHPGDDQGGEVKLHPHLEDVAERAVTITQEDATTPSGEALDDALEILGLVHDFGKATEWFQQHIDVQTGSPPSRLHKQHAPLGALAAYYLLDTKGFDDETCLAGFVAVWWHHGPLPDVVEAVFERTIDPDHANRRDTLNDQVENIDAKVPGFAREVFDSTPGSGSWEEFARLVRDGDLISRIGDRVSHGFGHTKQQHDDALSDAFYGLALQCWGTLVLADKTSAAGAPDDDRIYEGTKPSFERLDEYVDRLESNARVDDSREGRLNRLRSQARSEVLESVNAFAASDDEIATITLPTGLGKTLTGLSAALKLRDETDRDRVVYALPFTSIIDQVADEVQDIYTDDDVEGRSGIRDVLTVHHHLADATIEDDDERADLRDRVAGMLGESWRAGMTITTFVQLFESLAGPKNGQSMKLPALQDSVVVLDEPQSLPHDWWKLVDRIVRLLTDQYDVTVIAMTATQPHLFGDGDEFSLVDDRRDYFEAVERVRYRIDASVERFIEGKEDPLSYESAASRLSKSLDEGESTLAICNTIESARTLSQEVENVGNTVDLAEMYRDRLETVERASDLDPESLAGHVANTSNEPIFCHLTTRIRPVDRLTLIETIKGLLDRGVRTLVVSTQLVEAGVDISFDRIYRDLAPLDSIVQAAGRCNRSFERNYGDVNVWWLEAPGDQDHTPAGAVYQRPGPSLLSDTATVLERVRDEQDERLSETEVSVEGVERYYRRLNEERNVGKNEYVDHVDRAEAASLRELSLIDERETADVLVCRTRSEFELVERIHEAYESFDFEKTRNLIDRTQSFRVSVPVYDHDSETARALGDLTPLPESNIYVLDARPGHDDQYFDPTTGFVVPDESVEARFL